MIIPTHALGAVFTPPKDVQGSSEAESGFGHLLAEVETQAPGSSDQDEGERRALDSLLQALETIFQSLPPAQPLPAGPAAGTGASGLASGLSPEGAALAALSSPRIAPELQGASTHLLSRMTPNALPGMQHTACAAEDGQHEAPAAVTTVLQNSVSLGTELPAAQLALAATAPGSSAALASTEIPPDSQPGPGTPLTGTGDAQARTAQPLPQAASEAGLTPLSASAPAQHGTTVTGQPPHLAEAPASPLTVPQGTASVQEAGESRGVGARPMPSETSLTDHDSPPLARRVADIQQHTPEATATVPPLFDASLMPPRTGGMSSTLAPESGSPAPPPSYSLENMTDTRQWPRLLPSNTVLLHLEPHGLGAVLVHVRVSEKRLIASFRAQSPEVETLLRAQLPALHASLSQQGFDVQPIAITLAAEGFSTQMGTGTGAFAQQYSTFHQSTQDQPASHGGEPRHTAEPSSIPPWSAERGHRLLNVLI